MFHYFLFTSYHINELQPSDKNISTHTQMKFQSLPWSKSKVEVLFVVFLHTALYKRKPRAVAISCTHKCVPRCANAQLGQVKSKGKLKTRRLIGWSRTFCLSHQIRPKSTPFWGVNQSKVNSLLAQVRYRGSITDIHQRYQTSYTTQCNGVVSHRAQFGGLPVFTKQPKQNQMQNKWAQDLCVVCGF